MFESAANAVAAANTAQQQIELPVRMGIHTGDAEEPDGDFFGSSVSSLGDLNGDAVTDLAVGAFADDTGGEWPGRGACAVA